jgi:hypothetical protein
MPLVNFCPKLRIIGPFHLIFVPPCRGYMFFIVIPLKNSRPKTFYPWRIPSSKPFIPEEFPAQNLSPLTISKLKTFYPWRIPSSKPFTPKEFQNSKLKTLYPWRIPSSKPFTPEEFQTQNPLPQKNSKLWKIAISSLFSLYPWRIPNSKHFNPEEFQEEF